MSDAARTHLPRIDRPRLDAVVGPIVRAHGAEVVDIEFKTERGSWVLRIDVEKLGSAERKLSAQQAAVDLTLCAEIARDLSPALDVAELISHGYNLEVSSPGVERPLRGEGDFIRFAGQKARLRLHAPVAGQKVQVGVLGPVQAGSVALDVGGQTYEIPLTNIASARLVFEFGPAPKAGKKKRSRG